MSKNSHLPTLFLFKGINSPQALKKILSLSEEGSLDRHKKQSEDTISSASSQLSSPPTSPQSSPRKGIRRVIFLVLFPEALETSEREFGHSGEITAAPIFVTGSQQEGRKCSAQWGYLEEQPRT